MKTNDLPYLCYVQTEAGETVVIQNGQVGYFKNILCETPDGQQNDVDEINKKCGITKEQTRIMEAGSMFGWDIPMVVEYK